MGPHGSSEAYRGVRSFDKVYRGADGGTEGVDRLSDRRRWFGSAGDGEASVSRIALYKAAYPFQEDVLALPVEDLDRAVEWYGERFSLREVERRQSPEPTVILERDGVRIGFAVNGGDASQDGAAILVGDIAQARDELEDKGVAVGNWRIDERDDGKYQVFFVVAPDGLCFYFHAPVE